jgi:hypothetical protein
MATKKTRAWFVDKLIRIGIVEKGNNIVTKDGYTTDWGSISEVKDLRMYTISKDADLAINALTSSWVQIPSQFHEGIVYKAIAQGYKDPRHMEIQLAQYFDMEFATVVKSAKKYSKSNYQSTGTIKPQEF